MKKRMTLMGAVCVLAIAALAAPAAAGDVMSWQPSTPAGGASPAFLPSLLQQAMAIELGPEALTQRDLNREQVTTQQVFTFDANGLRKLAQEQETRTKISVPD